MIHTVRRADRPALDPRPRARRGPRVSGGWAWIVPLLVLVAALLPRWLAPSPFLTWDEPTWTYRSLRFARALETGAFEDTWQSPHPGVVTMWAATAGITVKRLALPEEGDGSAEADGQVGVADGGVEVPSDGNGAGSGSGDSADGSRPDTDAIHADTPYLVHGRTPTRSLAFVDALPEFDEDDVTLLRQVLPWLGVGRRAIAVVCAALIAWIAWLLIGLVGPWTALLAGMLLAFDPWLLAHSRVLHLDAVLSLLLVASVVATLRDLHGDGRFWLFTGGALGGLAMLEKSPGLFAAPFALLLIFGLILAREGLSGRSIVRAVRDGAGWLLAAALSYGLAWPAMWVDPLGTGGRMLGYALDAAGGAREAVFFAGAVQPDPGIVFYLTALAFRMTPLVAIGLVALVLLAPVMLRGGRITGPILLLFALLFVLAMGQSAKKFTRYSLPALVALDVAAASGLAALALRAAEGRWREGRINGGGREEEEGDGESAPATGGLSDPLAARARQRQAGTWAMGVLGVAVAIQAVWSLTAQPYYLTRFAPHLGGARNASRWLPIGWGEGSERAVAWLNAQPNAASLRVATPAMTLIGPGFVGETRKARDWATADFVVLTVDDAQIGQPDVVSRYYGVRTPTFVALVEGVEVAWIYPGGDP